MSIKSNKLVLLACCRCRVCSTTREKEGGRGCLVNMSKAERVMKVSHREEEEKDVSRKDRQEEASQRYNLRL